MKRLGQITRGKTAPNRLRKTDTFLSIAFTEWVRRMPGVYVDLGYGTYPVTSVETLTRLRMLNPRLRVIGVEIDPDRVAGALPYTRTGLEFRLGGFNLPLRSDEPAAVVRAFNVLRQYDEAEVSAALAALRPFFAPGGLLLEGTCDPTGRLMTFNLFRQEGDSLNALGLVLAPDLSQHFRPRQLQAVLPKNFIHHAEPGGALDRFFGDWERSWSAARAHGQDPRHFFSASARHLIDRGYPIDPRCTLLRRGFLWLTSPPT